MRSPAAAAALALLAALAAPAAARAQDVSQFAGALAAGVEQLGQSVGESLGGGASVFVTATGHAPLPAPLVDAYLVNIEGRSASAVDAQKLRDQRLQAARAAADRFGVAVEIGSTSFTHEVDVAAQQRRRSDLAAQRAAHPGTVVVEPPAGEAADRLFVARTGVRFRAADPQKLPAFLDALQAAGVDGLSGTPAAAAGLFGAANQVLGFGTLAQVDPAVWDRAEQDALADARRQAAVLASASGRKLGEARQILLLSRSVQASTATVSVAARFAFAPGG